MTSQDTTRSSSLETCLRVAETQGQMRRSDLEGKQIEKTHYGDPIPSDHLLILQAMYNKKMNGTAPAVLMRLVKSYSERYLNPNLIIGQLGEAPRPVMLQSVPVVRQPPPTHVDIPRVGLPRRANDDQYPLHTITYDNYTTFWREVEMRGMGMIYASGREARETFACEGGNRTTGDEYLRTRVRISRNAPAEEYNALENWMIDLGRFINRTTGVLLGGESYYEWTLIQRRPTHRPSQPLSVAIGTSDRNPVDNDFQRITAEAFTEFWQDIRMDGEAEITWGPDQLYLWACSRRGYSDTNDDGRTRTWFNVSDASTLYDQYLEVLRDLGTIEEIERGVWEVVERRFEPAITATLDNGSTMDYPAQTMNLGELATEFTGTRTGRFTATEANLANYHTHSLLSPFQLITQESYDRFWREIEAGTFAEIEGDGYATLCAQSLSGDNRERTARFTFGTLTDEHRSIMQDLGAVEHVEGTAFIVRKRSQNQRDDEAQGTESDPREEPSSLWSRVYNEWELDTPERIASIPSGHWGCKVELNITGRRVIKIRCGRLLTESEKAEIILELQYWGPTESYIDGDATIFGIYEGHVQRARRESGFTEVREQPITGPDLAITDEDRTYMEFWAQVDAVRELNNWNQSLVLPGSYYCNGVARRRDTSGIRTFDVVFEEGAMLSDDEQERVKAQCQALGDVTTNWCEDQIELTYTIRRRQL